MEYEGTVYRPWPEANSLQKTILITGSTDGIGLETAKMLASAGHHVLLHGRSAKKLAIVLGCGAAPEVEQLPPPERFDWGGG